MKIFYVFFLLFIVVVVTLAKGIVLQPYLTRDYEEYVIMDQYQRGDVSYIHPFYSPKNYILPGLKIPPALAFNPWFNFACAFFSAGLNLGVFLVFCRYIGLSALESMIASVFTLYFSEHVLFNGYPMPNPFVVYGQYDTRMLVVPVAALGLYFFFRRSYIAAGLVFGLSAVLHIKFGLRFFAYVFSCALLWNMAGLFFSGIKSLRVPLKGFVLTCVFFLMTISTTLVQIVSTRNYFLTLHVPRAQELITPLAWLMKNEPDDWLISYLGMSGLLQFFGVAALNALLCGLIIKTAGCARSRVAAAVIFTANITASGFFLAGVVFEKWFLSFLKPAASLSIVLLRFWDVMWVAGVCFWLAASMLFFDMAQKKLGNMQRYSRTLRVLLGAAVFLLVMISALRVHKHGGRMVSTGTLEASGYVYTAEYRQICDPDLAKKYKKTWESTLNAVRNNDGHMFEQNLSALQAMRFSGADALNFIALRDFTAGNYGEALCELKAVDTQVDPVVSWRTDGCGGQSGETRLVSVNIPLPDYQDAARWISRHLPRDAAVVNPPYLLAFNMFSRRIGFWDGKTDQHPMYMIPGYYTAGLHRLYLVAGKYTLETNPGFTFGDTGERGREFYLALTDRDFMNIKRQYPAYDYVLTEKNRSLGLSMLYENKTFAVYQIKRAS